MMNKQGMQYILRLPMLVSGGSMLCEIVPLRKVPSSLHSTVLLEVQSAARLVNMTLHLDSALNLTESQLSPPTKKAGGWDCRGPRGNEQHFRGVDQTSRLQKQRSCLLFSACGLVRHEDVSNPMGFHINTKFWMKMIILLFLLLILIFSTHANILSVALDGSQDFTVIQEAIDASAHGDTVLVYPGRYYENVKFNGKNITLASLELLTGHRDYVYSTIIDGNQNGPVVRTTSGETSIHIQGFTITNGSGAYNEAYDMTVGGGIIVSHMSGARSASIVNCEITGNRATNGGGFWGGVCHLILSGVSIHDNLASVGGGMQYEGSLASPYSITFDPVNRSSIYSNYAAFGSDLYFYNVNSVHVVVDTFTVANPWNFYATAVPSNPSISNPYTFDILHTVHEEVNHDLYVAPWGDDTNSGLNPAEPMQSIFMAMYRIASDGDNPKTVYVANGHYSPSLNGQLFPIPIKSYTSLVGESREGTILDAEDESIFFNASPGSNGWNLERLSFRNGKGGFGISRSANYQLREIAIESVYNDYYPIGISTIKTMGNRELSNVAVGDIRSRTQAKGYSSNQASGSLKLHNVEISDCQAPQMNAITISTIDECDIVIDGLEVHNNRSSSSDMFGFNSMFQISPWENNATRLRIDIKNSAFYDNYQGTANHMAMARSLNDTLFISNCTFAGNSGGSTVIAVQGTNVLTNNIFYNPDNATQIMIPNNTSSGIYSPTTLINNNILGGTGAVYNATTANPLIWGPGNSSDDPLFVNEGNRPYLLSALSPLIDMGLQPALIEPTLDAAGNERYIDGNSDGLAVIDIGAYEYQTIYSPLELDAELWQQQILLYWQMPLMDRGLSGFRIYRNGQPYAEIADPQTTQFRDYSAVNDTLTYYLVALYGAVESSPSNSVTVIIDTVANADEQGHPASISLKISPNPFRDLAVISYQLSKASETELKLYNLRGQLVRELHKGTAEKGEQVLAWEGCDDRGQDLPAGVYLLRLSIDGKTQKPLKLLKL